MDSATIRDVSACGHIFWSQRIMKAEAELLTPITVERRRELEAKIAHYEGKLAELRP